ncbi:MarR family EPS-associated transcriptional regulator [Sulfitobacter sp. JBTF-M27]|uniref:MarR family EPS-associated transcriptional regulator n=1 Tax=Sulfitobacter sediminilitoris TaxID=2698830 RepID=A0A6P0CI22_9RHOB|nr:MarR family EPS-associated transcriptional regulator [Sulfitobacter sediminilitoris]NEK25050.1 MarR family EPS-associated transcriptional regulator [Sulfitobacter sediminilitoris]
MSVAEEGRFRVLRLLEQSPDLSQRQLASELGVSPGAVNFCLLALGEKGQVQIGNVRGAENKMRYAYVLTPKGISEKPQLTGAFLKRKLAEHETLKAETQAIEAEAGREQSG